MIMNRLIEIAEAFTEGEKKYKEIMASDECMQFCANEYYGGGNICGDMTNRTADGDNLQYMKFLIRRKKLGGMMQLIYVDPPFFSNGKYRASVKMESDILGQSPLIKVGAYDDYWGENLKDYLTMLTVRFFMMRELLSETGCLWVHLDWHAVHYVKVILDEIFGEKNFINEIIWTYKSGGTNKRSFSKKHDTLLIYGKSSTYKFNRLTEKSYNRDLKPYRFKGVEEFEDEKGWYTKVNMKDVWNIDMVGRTSSERTGYATQKPEKLMERIISSCSDEGDLCADFFAGSGTFGDVCGALNRRWIMCDSGYTAISSQINRLADGCTNFAVERAGEQSEQTNGSISLDVGENSCGHSSIKLLKYSPDMKDICCSDDAVVLKYLKEDSLSLIKFWSIDTDFDGKLHRAGRVYSGEQRTVHFEKKLQKGKNSFVGYDIFGKRISKVF